MTNTGMVSCSFNECRGGRYYYPEKGVRAGTRAALTSGLGEETSAWQNRELAAIFEQFIREHRVEERKPPSHRDRSDGTFTLLAFRSAKDIKYRAPSEIPVPESLVEQWRRLPLTDERLIEAYKTAYQRREWKHYLKGLSPCARAGLSAWQERNGEASEWEAIWSQVKAERERGGLRTAEEVRVFAERFARKARDRVLLLAGYDPSLVVRERTRRAP